MKIFKKSLAILALLELVLGNNLVVAVWAAESLETTIAPTETPTVENTITPTPTIALPPQCISDNSCDVSPTPVNQTIFVNQTNTSADSGNNINDSEGGNVDTVSGESNAQSDTNNQINSNNSQNTTPSPTQNIASGTNTEVVAANSGQNQASGVNATLETGNAVAYANLVNLINTNVSGSSFKVYLVNNFNQNLNEIDLNKMWKELVDSSSAKEIQVSDNSSVRNVVLINNQASVDNNITVMANTGFNSARGSEQVLVISGNATALANVINLLNTNVIGSNFFAGIINVDGSKLGDLILPRPDKFTNSNNGVWGTSQNSSTINNNANTNSNSGENQAEGTSNSIVSTGNALAWTNINTMANINSNSYNHFMLAVNTMGSWNGQVYNWSSPGSVEQMSGTNLVFSNWGDSQGFYGSQVNILNTAKLNNNVLVSANSGNNNAQGGQINQITTGNSTAITNINNLVNVNLWNSNWFFGVVNIVGDWKGNIVYAYPDLAVAISSLETEVGAGRNLEYAINYANLGYDDIDKAVLSLELPKGVEYVSDNSGLQIVETGKIIKWFVGNVNSKSSRVFNVTLRSKPKYEEASLISRIVPVAWAAEEKIQKIVEIKARIEAEGGIETDLKNNEGKAKTYILYSQITDSEPDTVDSTEDTSTEDSNKLPELNISAANNVNDHVYPGDTVLFEIKLKNNGERDSKDSKLIHEIYSPNGKLWKREILPVGLVKSGKGGKVVFGILTDSDLKEFGNYKSKTRLIGLGPRDFEVGSNMVETNFAIKPKGLVGGVYAAEPSIISKGGETMGVSSCSNCQSKAVLPYLILFASSSLWIINKTDRWIKLIRQR